MPLGLFDQLASRCTLHDLRVGKRRNERVWCLYVQYYDVVIVLRTNTFHERWSDALPHSTGLAIGGSGRVTSYGKVELLLWAADAVGQHAMTGSSKSAVFL